MLTKGQSVLEYLLLISIITMALMFMGTDLKRGVQSVLKVTSDQLGQQENAEQDYSGKTGYMLNSASNVWQQRNKTEQEFNRIKSKIVNDEVTTVSSTVTNQGIIE